MAKFKPKRKTRSDKFPLTLHATGQHCKKIKGKVRYFGSAEGVSAVGLIKLKSGLTAAEELSVLAHEAAYEILHRDNATTPKDKKVR